MSINIESARLQMLGQQIRAWEVLDEGVLEILRSTPREQFVPEEYRDLAFADTEIPIGHGQAMMAPKLEGRLLQALRLTSADDVLEIGTGSGYLTACLAKAAASVVSIDIFAEFVEAAEQRLYSRRIQNAELSAADAFALNRDSGFDVVAVTGSVPVIPDHFIDMLRPEGRMFVVVGRPPIMEARLVTRHANGEWVDDSLFETYLTPLINADSPEPFKL